MVANSFQIGGSHYKDMAVEPWDVVDTWPIEQRIGSYRAGALKYLMRMGTKDEQLQEVRKARHYLDKLIEVLSEKVANKSEKPTFHSYYPPMKATLEEAYETVYKGVK